MAYFLQTLGFRVNSSPKLFRWICGFGWSWSMIRAKTGININSHAPLRSKIAHIQTIHMLDENFGRGHGRWEKSERAMCVQCFWIKGIDAAWQRICPQLSLHPGSFPAVILLKVHRGREFNFCVSKYLIAISRRNGSWQCRISSFVES